jgi:hypothetical protein
VDCCFETFDEKTAKMMVNSFVGLLGRKKKIETEGCFTKDRFLANAFKLDEMSKVTLNSFKDMFFITKTETSAILNNSIGIHQHILSLSIIELFKMTEKLVNEKSVIYGFTHDCIYLSNANEIKTGNEMGDIDREKVFDDEVLFGEWIKQTRGDVEKMDREPLTIDLKNWKEITLEVIDDSEMNIEPMFDEPDGIEQSFLLYGEAGFAKTGLIIEFIKKTRKEKKKKKILVLAFQNSVVEDYQRKGVDVILDNTKDVTNFHRFFGFDENGNRHKLNSRGGTLNNYDILVVEEGFCVPKWLLHSVSTFEGQFIFVGDDKQQLPIESREENDLIVYNYLHTDFLKEKCDYRKFVVPYHPKYSRLSWENVVRARKIRNEGKLDKV